jgi:hypothetical protein
MRSRNLTVTRMVLAPLAVHGGVAYQHTLLNYLSIPHQSWNTQEQLLHTANTWRFVDIEEPLDF